MQEVLHSQSEGTMLSKQQVDFSDEDDLLAVKAILETAPSRRSKQELAFLKTAFKNISYFNDMLNSIDDELQETILREVRIVKVSKAKTVFEAGTTGRNFYMLLRGSVYILARSAVNKVMKQHRKKMSIKPIVATKNMDPDSNTASPGLSDFNGGGETGRESASNTPRVIPKRSIFDSKKEAIIKVLDMKNSPRESSVDGSIDEGMVSQKDKGIYPESVLMAAFPHYTLLATLTAPTYFGEIALNTQQPRTATVVCKEECYMATLSGVTYSRILRKAAVNKNFLKLFSGEHYEEKHKNEIEFFTKVPLFANWPIANLSAILRGFVERRFCKGDRIFKQGTEANSLFLVKSGEVELTKKTKFYSNQKERNLLMPFALKQSTSTKVPYERMNSVWKSQIDFKKEIHVAIIGKGEVFGDTDLVADVRKREHTAICYSANAEVYEIDRKVFFSNATNPDKLVQELRDYNNKTLWRNNFAKEIKQLNLTNASEVGKPVKREKKVDDSQALSLKNKISARLHIDGEIENVIRERDPLKLEVNPSSVEEIRLFDKKETIARDFSHLKGRADPSKPKILGRSVSIDQLQSPVIMSSITGFEEPSHRGEGGTVLLKANTMVGLSQHGTTSAIKRENSIVISQSYSPERSQPSKILKKKLSLIHLQSARTNSIYSSSRSLTKGSRSMLPSARVSPNSSVLGPPSLFNTETKTIKTSAFSITEAEKEGALVKILDELKTKELSIQKIHKRLKIPELMSTKPNFYIHKLQSDAKPAPKHNLRSKSVEIAVYELTDAGHTPSINPTIEGSILPRILLPNTKPTPIKTQTSSTTYSKILLSLDPPKTSARRLHQQINNQTDPIFKK